MEFTLGCLRTILYLGNFGINLRSIELEKGTSSLACQLVEQLMSSLVRHCVS